MRVGIDLLWVRPGKNGGTESYIRNLLDGFYKYAGDQYHFILFTTNENHNTFAKYKDKFEIKIYNCPSSQIKRVIWETMFLNKNSRKENLDVWFYPVYSRPLFPPKNVPNITVIHDLQGLHYPEYFSKVRNTFFRVMWKRDIKSSTKIVTISEFCKKDLISHYHVNPNKVQVIYNAIDANGPATEFSKLSIRYGIEEKNYYYTVSSLAKHKNLITLLKSIKLLKKELPDVKLLISGVKVNAENEISEFIEKNNLKDNIIYTGFISDEDRNGLIDNCKKFLFPSIFEGFGMPPVEAMIRGVPVLTTRCTSLEEVTEGLCEYVNNPTDPEEWCEKINQTVVNKVSAGSIKEKYSLQNITRDYLDALKNTKEIN